MNLKKKNFFLPTHVLGDIVRGDFVLGGYCPGDIVRGDIVLIPVHIDQDWGVLHFLFHACFMLIENWRVKVGLHETNNFFKA